MLHKIPAVTRINVINDHSSMSVTALGPPRFPLDCPLPSTPSLPFPPSPLTTHAEPSPSGDPLGSAFLCLCPVHQVKPIGMQKCLHGESLVPLQTQLLQTLPRRRNLPIVMPSEYQRADCHRVAGIRVECSWSSKDWSNLQQNVGCQRLEVWYVSTMLFWERFLHGTSHCGKVEVYVGALKYTGNDRLLSNLLLELAFGYV